MGLKILIYLLEESSTCRPHKQLLGRRPFQPLPGLVFTGKLHLTGAVSFGHKQRTEVNDIGRRRIEGIHSGHRPPTVWPETRFFHDFAPGGLNGGLSCTNFSGHDLPQSRIESFTVSTLKDQVFPSPCAGPTDCHFDDR